MTRAPGAVWIGVAWIGLACGGGDRAPLADAPPDPDAAPTGDACPAPGALPDGQPFHDYAIDGARLFGDAVRSWRWTVTGGPCDRLFARQGKPTSFELGGAETSRPTFKPAVAGDYTVHVELVAADGANLACSFVVHVAGAGLGIELCWDTTGIDDLDLHVHLPHSTTSWFSLDDCYYHDCKATSTTHVDWGYAPSPLTACVGSPDGAAWSTLGGCINPRLELDNIDREGRAEVMNLDRPEDGASYRVMADYYAGLGETHPIANVYCQGRLVASFGQAPDVVPGFDTPDIERGGSMWRIADVTTHVDAIGGVTCDVQPLHPRGQAAGYDVRIGDPTF